MLSFLAGLIGGVTFVSLLLRGFLAALVFGVLALAVDAIIRRFLPELLGIEESAETDGVERPGVDITLEDENPHKSEGEADGQELKEAGQSDAEPESEMDDEVAELEVVSEDPENLPNFDGVETTFATTEVAQSDAISQSSDATPYVDSVSEKGSVEVMGDEEDPAIVAKAIRTIMNKDAEG